MQITKEDVDKVVSLAKLHFSEEEKEKFRGHLDQILTYVEKLNELNTEDVEPTYYVQHTGEVMREDRVEKSLSQEEALKNAPAKVRGFVCVPKVISQSRRKKN